jgi:crossover junction endodeoxyribonuclease RuvC
MPFRLKTIYDDLSELVQHHSPQCIAIEQLFFTNNITTGISVGQARGVVMLVGEQHGLELAEYTPLQVKQSVTGYGKATKSQVQQMVKTILGLKEIPKPDDAADALAIAICHGATLKPSDLV